MDNIMFNLTHGMYIITANGGGCVVDAVSQVSGGENPLISVAIMKTNYTNQLLKNNSTACLSILGEKTNGEVIREFGLKSMRDYNKFEYSGLIDIEGLKVVKDSIGYLMLEKVDSLENETHTLFIYKVVSTQKLNDDIEISYRYYREHKDELLKVKTEEGKTAWICTVCNYIYYGEEIPSDYVCPICGVGPELFSKK